MMILTLHPSRTNGSAVTKVVGESVHALGLPKSVSVVSFPDAKRGKGGQGGVDKANAWIYGWKGRFRTRGVGQIFRECAEGARRRGSGLAPTDGKPGPGIIVTERFGHLGFRGPVGVMGGSQIGIVVTSRGLC